MRERLTWGSKQRWLTVACWLVAAQYAVGGEAKYLPGDAFFGISYAEKFVGWGYPSWFRFVVGTGELVAAVLLVVPRRRFRFLAASILVVIMAGAVITHVVSQDMRESLTAPTYLVVSALMAWGFRPAQWRDLWAPQGAVQAAVQRA